MENGLDLDIAGDTEICGLFDRWGTLSYAEEFLISRVSAQVQVLVLPNGGQYGYRNSCIS